MAAVVATVLLAGGLCLTACGDSGDDTASGDVATNTAVEEINNGGNADDASGYPKTIEHAMGETVLDSQPQTVVALDRGVLDTSIAVGLQVIGFTEIAGSDGIPDYFGEDGDVYAKNAELVGTLSEPNLERIATLKPDLILSAKVRHEELYPQLSKIAPTVFTEKTGGTWKENLELTGRATDRVEEAKEKLDEYEARAERIGDRVREKLGGNPTVSVVRFVDGPTRIYKEDTYIGVIMNDLGFEKTETSAGTGFNIEISEEQIDLMDADHIFITTYADEDGLSESIKEDFKANPLWEKLDGEIHEEQDGIWMSAVGLYGANAVLDDVANAFGVEAS
ncbi:ABC transporter substrate-binding protein [Corynebacterium sp. TAE3-ERU16]|uniref:ABC transporter substrate-binding protein n=1 Tax=Corynebacterium sp. TAE3-ERU16 TaxID=2849493 RepID=UPI001C46E740|nr:iron-siderophore ABC transporter substrate-binding protein [Corynebacterium sp. TAE3-ERU16]MBV7292910.1 iron-siderophore ABC transporter substrate-binding protein [Corynebacterium sp. TAE3-ERU16]